MWLWQIKLLRFPWCLMQRWQEVVAIFSLVPCLSMHWCVYKTICYMKYSTCCGNPAAVLLLFFTFTLAEMIQTSWTHMHNLRHKRLMPLTHLSNLKITILNRKGHRGNTGSKRERQLVDTLEEADCLHLKLCVVTLGCWLDNNIALRCRFSFS